MADQLSKMAAIIIGSNMHCKSALKIMLIALCKTLLNMSCVMRKPAFAYYAKNKYAGQLCGNR